MIRRTPSSTRTYTLVPYTTRFRTPNAGNSSAYVDTEERANYYAKLFMDTGYMTVTIHQPVVPAPTETSAIGHADVALRAALDRKSTRLNSSHLCASRMPPSASKKHN